MGEHYNSKSVESFVMQTSRTAAQINALNREVREAEIYGDDRRVIRLCGEKISLHEQLLAEAARDRRDTRRGAIGTGPEHISTILDRVLAAIGIPRNAPGCCLTRHERHERRPGRVAGRRENAAEGD